jgi:serine/threonine-protein kinase
MSEPREGEVLAGKYRIERVLGVGGMGMVVSAMHLQLDERVALKFLLPQALANPEAVARFAREARAAVKIRSEHVARVTDVGTLDTGAPYMVMELLRGRDLSVLLREQRVLPIAQTVEYLLQACEALAEAHALGIVHRDLKPANLFLTARADGSPCVKVLDFGISKLAPQSGSGSDMGMTRTQSLMGSPLYMSPEQLASARDVDQRADIWSMGAVLYELLTGHVPFTAESVPQLCTLILHVEPPPPRSYRPELPEGLEGVIWRCLRKDRAQRYQNVAELAADLAQFAGEAGPRSAERISRVLSSSSLSPTDFANSGVTARSSASNTNPSHAWGHTQTARSKRALWFGLAAAGIALGAVVVVVRALGSAPEQGAVTAGTSTAREVPAPVEAPSKANAPASSETTPPSTAAPGSASAPVPALAPSAKAASERWPPRSTKSPVTAKSPSKSGNEPAAQVDPLSERH